MNFHKTSLRSLYAYAGMMLVAICFLYSPRLLSPGALSTLKPLEYIAFILFCLGTPVSIYIRDNLTMQDLVVMNFLTWILTSASVVVLVILASGSISRDEALLVGVAKNFLLWFSVGFFPSTAGIILIGSIIKKFRRQPS